MKLVLPSLVALPFALAIAYADNDPAENSPLVQQPAPAASLTQVPAALAPAAVQGRSQGVPSGAQALGTVCSTIDFETFTEGEAIGTVLGAPNVTFGSSWFATVDNDEPGGAANIANEPSASTVATFTDVADPINFDLGVRYVELFYSASAASVPVTLTAWDDLNGTGNIIDMQMGTTVGVSADGANCSGDPTGNFCLWDTLALTAPTDSIRSITISGAAVNSFAFDNMQFCTEIPCAVAATNAPLHGSNINPAGTLFANELPTLGSQTYSLTIDDTFDSCGLSTGGVLVYLCWSPMQIQVSIPNFGCGPGDPGELFAAPPFLQIDGPLNWAPGNPAVYHVPVPAGSAKCGFEFIAQGFFFDPNAPGGPFIMTNALSVVLGN
ncbi:MAG: hypothetical protein WD226_14640 [Planctomycetota bacterium]